jgi:hypothetical protein
VILRVGLGDRNDPDALESVQVSDEPRDVLVRSEQDTFVGPRPHHVDHRTQRTRLPHAYDETITGGEADSYDPTVETDAGGQWFA